MRRALRPPHRLSRRAATHGAALEEATAAMADTSAGGHPKLSFAAAARAVATSTNKEKFERLKASREKAKTKLALARVEIARCVWAPCTACAALRLSSPALLLRRRLQQEAAASAGTRAASSGAVRPSRA